MELISGMYLLKECFEQEARIKEILDDTIDQN